MVNQELLLHIRAVADGRESQFSDVIRLSHRELRLFLSVRLPNAELCEEMLQVTYIAAFEQLRRGNRPQHGLAWLRGIARRQAAQALDEVHKRERPMDALDMLVLLKGSSPDQEIVDAESKQVTHDALRDCLENLTDRTRLVLEGAYVAKQSHKQLAQRFKTPATKITKLLFRTRAQLRICLQTKGVVS